jgi:predicted DCC family thiol-disulfide oxidoreductase YuxK
VDDLDSVYVVVDYEMLGERLLARSDAVIFVLKELGSELRSAGQRGAAVPIPAKAEFRLWRALGFVLQVLPRGIRDRGYGVVARRRYRVFGRYDRCPVPTAETRGRFMDRDS